MRRGALVAAAGVLAAGTLAVPSVPTAAHEERPSEFPPEPGTVPRYRRAGPALLVCNAGSAARIEALGGGAERRNEELLGECRRDGFRTIQGAIDHVRRKGTRILIMPGVYRERRWARPPEGRCAQLADQHPLSYGEHRACPHVQNLIAILGDSNDPDRECDLPVCRLQLEGTGRSPDDVVIDNRFAKLNGIRADRADGVYFRNFTVQHAEFNALYVIETDGFVIDRVVGRWNEEYGFLTFSSDHGLYKRCEAYGNGDSGLYPGSAADLHGVRPSIEIRGCDSHHNTLGYSGTAGNSTYVHDNEFHHNMAGVSMDSFFPDHPGLPQDAATFVNNRIYTNNEDYYEYLRNGTCDKPHLDRGYDQGGGLSHRAGADRDRHPDRRRQRQRVSGELGLRQLAVRGDAVLRPRGLPGRVRPREAVRHLARQPLPRQPHGILADRGSAAQRDRLLVGRGGWRELLAGQPAGSGPVDHQRSGDPARLLHSLTEPAPEPGQVRLPGALRDVEPGQPRPARLRLDPEAVASLVSPGGRR